MRLRIYLLADFATGRLAGRPIEVKTGAAPDLFRHYKPALTLRTRDVISGSTRTVEWALALSSIGDLDADALLAACPLTAPLLGWRATLDGVIKTSVGMSDLMTQLDRLWPEVPSDDWNGACTNPSDPADTLAQIVAGVDLVESHSPAPARRATMTLRDRIRQRIDSSGRVSRQGLLDVRKAVDEALGRQLHELLGDAAFQRHESAWRCLWSTLESADLRSGDVTIVVASSPRADAAAAIEMAGRDWAETGESAGASARGLWIADYPLTDDEATEQLVVAALRACAPDGVALLPLEPAYLTAAWNPEGHWAPSMPMLVGSETVSALVTALAAVPGRRVRLSCNRFLYRTPYGSSSAVRQLPAFVEAESALPYANAPWIAVQGCVALAARAGLNAVVDSGAVVVSGLPVRTAMLTSGREVATPLEWLFTPADAAILLESGISPLTAIPQRDDAVMLQAGFPRRQ